MNVQKLFGVQHYLAMHKSCLSAFITLYENKIYVYSKTENESLETSHDLKFNHTIDIR